MRYAYGRSYMIQKLQEAGRVVGHTPCRETVDSMKQILIPCSCTYAEHFGSWGEALKAAGYEKEGRQSEDEFKPGCWVKLRSWVDDAYSLEFGGVYSLHLRGTVVYIGSGFPVGKRMRNPEHSCRELFEREDVEVKVRRNRKRFEHTMIEARLIWRLKPRWNIYGI